MLADKRQATNCCWRDAGCTNGTPRYTKELHGACAPYGLLPKPLYHLRWRALKLSSALPAPGAGRTYVPALTPREGRGRQTARHALTRAAPAPSAWRHCCAGAALNAKFHWRWRLAYKDSGRGGPHISSALTYACRPFYDKTMAGITGVARIATTWRRAALYLPACRSDTCTGKTGCCLISYDSILLLPLPPRHFYLITYLRHGGARHLSAAALPFRSCWHRTTSAGFLYIAGLPASACATSLDDSLNALGGTATAPTHNGGLA